MSEASIAEDAQVAPEAESARVESKAAHATDLDNPAQGTADHREGEAPQVPAADEHAVKAEVQEPDMQAAVGKDSGDDGTHALLMTALMDMKSEYAKLAGLFSQNMQQLNKATRWAFS